MIFAFNSPKFKTLETYRSIVLGDILKAAPTSSTRYPKISFIQITRHRRTSLYGRGTADFDECKQKKSYITLWSCLVALCLDPITLTEIGVYARDHQGADLCRRPRAVFSSPMSEFFTIRTDLKPANNMFIFFPAVNSL